MNKQNVRAIKVKTQAETPKTLTYEVVFLLRKNDLRFDVADRRTMGRDIGDGWRSDHDQREVLNEHVDEFISNLELRGVEHTLLFEQDMQAI